MPRNTKKYTIPLTKKKQAPTRKKHLFWSEDFSIKTFQKRKKNTFVSQSKKNYQYFMKYQFQRRYLIFWAAILVGFILLFILLGPLFRVQDIFITRQGTVININQAYDSLDSIRGKNIFFLESKSIADRLKRSQNTIKNIKINVSLPHTLNIELQSYAPEFVSGEYIILENGVIIPTENLDTSLLPHLAIATDIKNMQMFGETLREEDLTTLKRLEQNISKNIIGFDIASMVYYPIEKEVILRWNLDTLFIFDLTGDLDSQIKQLAIYHREYADLTQNSYIYIDARIYEKLFICWYGNEFACRNNLTTIYGDSIFTLAFPPEPSQTLPPDLPPENPENTARPPEEQ